MSTSRRAFTRSTIVGLFSSCGVFATSFADCASRVSTALLRKNSLDPAWPYFVDLGTPERLGDCELTKASFDFAPGRGRFKGQVGTHFTHHKDVWHLQLELLSGDPIPEREGVLFKNAWDGPPLSELDKPLLHPWAIQFDLPASIDLAKVTYARITSCC